MIDRTRAVPSSGNSEVTGRADPSSPREGGEHLGLRQSPNNPYPFMGETLNEEGGSGQTKPISEASGSHTC